MKNFLNILITVFVILFFFSCKKDDDEIPPAAAGEVPELTTSVVTDTKGTRATCGGEITSDEGLTVTARGVCWSTSPQVSVADSKTTDGAGAGSFTSTITGLSPFTTYYVRAYATNSAGTGYGSAMAFTTSDITVGDNYQGGLVAYFFAAGDPGYVAGENHGFIAASSDQSTGIQWYNGSAQITGASSLLLGAGMTNTNAILSVQGAGNYAAKLCSDLTLGGYSDWYLPSYNELMKVYANKNTIGGFTNNNYWTSTETDAGTAAYISFSNGAGNLTNKNSLFHVRALRTF